jgi:Putative collagen-binding domain of a collagenase
MQMFKNQPNEEASYGPLMVWQEGLKAVGASQMHYLKNLMEQDSAYFDRKPAQDLVINQSLKYDYIAACQSPKAIYAYTYTGRNMTLRLGSIKSKRLRGYWYNPRNGEKTFLQDMPNKGQRTFDPPSDPQNGNDWVLVLEAT